MRHIHLEVSAVDPVDGSTKTLRLTSIDAHGSAATQQDGYAWEPVIIEWPERTVEVMSGGDFSPVSIDHGGLTFSIVDNPVWARYVWSGALGRIWITDQGETLTGANQWFEGSVSALEISDDVASIKLLGVEANLAVELLSATYAGSGGIEGPAGIRNRRKPWTSGRCDNVEPVRLYDGQYWVFQFHGYGAANGTRAVYENAIQLPAAKASVSTLAAAIAANPLPGEWVDIPAQGAFLLGAEPTGKITADVDGAMYGSTFPTTLDAICRHLVSQAGIPGSRINSASFATFTGSWCQYVDSETSVGDLIRQGLFDHGGYLISDRAGVLCAGDFFANKTPTDLFVDGSSEKLVTAQPRLVASPPAAYSVRIGHTRCWSTHSVNEISGALNALSDDLIAARDVADLAKATAEQAVADAATLLSKIDEMSADGILDRAEKKRLERDYAEASTQKAAVSIQATALGITAERYSYIDAIDALTAYLTGLSPAWDDSSQSTPIDRADFNSVWAAYAAAYVGLQNKMADVTAVRAGIADGKADQAIVVASDAVNAVGQVDSRVDQVIAVHDELAESVAADFEITSMNILAEASMAGSWRAETDQILYTAEGTPVRQVVEQLGIKVGGHEAYISTLQEVDGSGQAKYVLSVNGDGAISGIRALAGGGTSSLAFMASQFVFVDNAGQNPVTALRYENGVWKMTSVEVDRLKVGAMDFEFNAKKTVSASQISQGLPGGLIMKTGRYRALINDETSMSIVFDEPFPNECRSFVPVPAINAPSPFRDLWIQIVGVPTRFGATIQTQSSTSNNNNIDGFDWNAWGT